MDFAENDWVSVITEDGNEIALARIETLKQESPVTAQEIGGILGMRLLRPLARGGKGLPPVFDLAFLRFKEAHHRIKSGSQGWNGVAIQPAKLLVVAAPSAAWQAGAAIEPVAVAEVSSEDDPLVQGIDAALVIEKARDANEQQRLLSRALWSELPVLGSYAQFSIGPLRRMPREKAIELDTALALDQGVALSQRLSAASTLERALWNNNAPEDLGNKRILSALFELMREPHPAAHRFVIPMLHRLLVLQAPQQEDSAGRNYRALLMQGIPPLQRDALHNLQTLLGDSSIGNEANALLKVFVKP